MIGKSPKVLQGVKTDRSVIAKLKKSLQEKTFFQGQTINYKKDGSEYYVEWNISPLFNEEGTLIHFISFQSDITSQVRLIEANEELLIQQSKLASVGELMNTVAHQWKQPLNIIAGYSQIIRSRIKKINQTDQADIKNLKDSIELIIEQSNFMIETITTFQNFLRPVDIKKSFDIIKSIDETIALMRGELMENKIAMNFLSLEKYIKVKGNENEFKQVILNLLSNAKDAFSMQKTVIDKRIDIEVKIESSFISIEIIDNAGGIKTSPIEKVFENNFSTKGEKGTGIGLYIVKQIINRFKGRINVSLVKNGGTKFSIYLPQ